MNKTQVRQAQGKSPRRRRSLEIIDEKSTKTRKSQPSENISNSTSRLPGVRGVLVRFFRNGEVHHPGVKIAINELELKSWEAFLNYLNKQNKLILPTGGIQHVFTLDGREIRAMNKLQHRQSYVVASGSFTRTNFLHGNDSFVEDFENNQNIRRRSNFNVNEQIFILPYSKLNLYESLIFNRTSLPTFERWLGTQITDLLSRFVLNQRVTHLYAVSKFAFNEVLSFSQLFNMLKLTDTFIACTDEEFQHSRQYLKTVRPEEFLVHSVWLRKSTNPSQKFLARQFINDDQFVINWIYGYDAADEQRRVIHRIADNEILYAIGSICIIHQPISRQQRFYRKHKNSVTHLSTHRSEWLVASSEVVPSKDRSRVLIHIWNSKDLETVTELRRDQFGNGLSLISLAEKFILVVSRDKPKIILVVDWKKNELIFSVTNKTDPILSAIFVFNSNEWIACVTQQNLTFYQINWNAKPIRLAMQREADVQNVYTGAICCYDIGDRVIVGDNVGNIYLWGLVDQQPKLLAIKEVMLEGDVQCVGSIDDDDLVYIANSQNQLKIWNTETNQIDEIRIKDTSGPIRSVCCLRQGTKFTGLVIGTQLNTILFKQFQSAPIEMIACGPIHPSEHLCSNKDGSAFFSIVGERLFCKWDKATRSIEWSIKCPQIISCLDLHPERNIIVLGTEMSKVLVYDTITSFYITTIPLKINTAVKAIRFSPNGQHLAVGLRNGTIQMYDIIGNGEFRIRHEDSSIQNDNIAVNNFTWSVDSKYLLSVFDDGHFTIWSLPSFTTAKGRTISSISWQNNGHPVICSILEKPIIDEQSSVIVLSPNTVLANGKDGQIRLFRHYYERHFQMLSIGSSSVKTMVPLAEDQQQFLISTATTPSIIEVQINADLENQLH